MTGILEIAIKCHCDLVLKVCTRIDGCREITEAIRPKNPAFAVYV